VKDNIDFVHDANRVSGRMLTDTFRIAGIEIEEQSFVDADRANPMGFLDFWYGYEGALGLAPGWSTPATLRSSPWSSMVNKSLLEHNIFGIDVPRGLRGVVDITRTGEITFGSISRKYERSNFTTLATSNQSDGCWAVEAQALTMTNQTHSSTQIFDKLTLARIEAAGPFMGLPGTWMDGLRASVPHKCGFFWCFVDCLDRKHMPNLTFTLADHNFTITPYDYAPEITAGEQTTCLFMVWSTDGNFDVDSIVLSTEFLNAYYAVFDEDKREVHLAEAIW
jgi:saccharopepsin